jgi:hypothetical protein
VSAFILRALGGTSTRLEWHRGVERQWSERQETSAFVQAPLAAMRGAFSSTSATALPFGRCDTVECGEGVGGAAEWPPVVKTQPTSGAE